MFPECNVQYMYMCIELCMTFVFPFPFGRLCVPTHGRQFCKGFVQFSIQ